MEERKSISQNLFYQKNNKGRFPWVSFVNTQIDRIVGILRRVSKPKVKYIQKVFYNFFWKITSKQKRAHSKWVIDKGDKLLLRDNLNLSEKSLVLDIGGFKGDWATDIHKKYGPKILIFEAVPTYIDFLNLRFSGIKKINIFPYGLSNKDEELFFDVTGDSSRPSQGATGDQKVILKNVNHLFDDGIKGLEKVDLAKINIEGGEYPLLEALLESGKIRKIDKLLVQFHKFPSNYRKRYDKIVEELKLTHNRVWCYHLIWECWVKKELSSSPQ